MLKKRKRKLKNGKVLLNAWVPEELDTKVANEAIKRLRSIGSMVEVMIRYWFKMNEKGKS